VPRSLLSVVLSLFLSLGGAAFLFSQILFADSKAASSSAPKQKAESNTLLVPIVIGALFTFGVGGAGYFLVTHRKPASNPVPGEEDWSSVQPPNFVPAPNPLKKMILPAILGVAFVVAAIPVISSFREASQNLPNAEETEKALKEMINSQQLNIPQLQAGQFQPPPQINVQPPPIQVPKIPYVPQVPKMPSVPGAPGFRR
jgi:hypothetical protein